MFMPTQQLSICYLLGNPSLSGTVSKILTVSPFETGFYGTSASSKFVMLLIFWKAAGI